MSPNSLTTEILVVDLDGGNLTRVPGSEGALGPRWSPDGSHIAFLRDGDIHVMDADGSNARRLTNDPEYDGNFAWSPDGERIAFASLRHDDSEIFVMDADGSNLVRLTHHPALDTAPAWSPDGSRIAFVSGREGGGLYTTNLDGTEVTRLLAWTSTLQWTTGPSWSPIEH